MFKPAYRIALALALCSCASANSGSNAESGEVVWSKWASNIETFARDFRRDNFQCSIIARNTAPVGLIARRGIVAEIANAIDTASQQQQIYEQCMVAQGYTPSIR
jgi:hypothetical protein